VGPDAGAAGAHAARAISVAALLAAILPFDRLVEPISRPGFFDQWALRGISEELLMLLRILAHWLSLPACR